MDKQDYNMEDKRQEYTRLNDELLMRIKNCYGDGVMLASFYLIFYATLIGAFCEILIGKTVSVSALVFLGIIFSVTFSLAIWILHAFAEKFKENFLGICNISRYLTFYHEMPSFSEGKDFCKKWEMLHKNTMKETPRETKDYFLLGMLALSLFLISITAIMYLLVVHVNFRMCACFAVGLVALFFLVWDILYLVRIFRDTAFKILKNKDDEIVDFYEKQAQALGFDVDIETYQNIKSFGKNWK